MPRRQGGQYWIRNFGWERLLHRRKEKAAGHFREFSRELPVYSCLFFACRTDARHKI
jgi:hypothetical protein